jgi:hypothetical protein
MTTRNVLICAVLASAPACSKSNDGAEKMITMMEDVAAAVDAAGGDCAKMADGVEAVFNKYDLKEIQAVRDSLKNDKEKAKQLKEKYADRMTKVMPKLMGMAKCSSEPKMKELEEKLKGAM